jgi:hypothetical protein
VRENHARNDNQRGDKAVISAPYNEQPPFQVSPTTPAQQQVLSWIHDVIVPALVDNFIKTMSSQQERAGE